MEFNSDYEIKTIYLKPVGTEEAKPRMLCDTKAREQLAGKLSSTQMRNIFMNSEKGAIFTYKNKQYFLMNDKISYNGKTYYGVLRANNFAIGTWHYIDDGIRFDVLKRAAAGEVTEYVNIIKGVINIQDYKSEHFGCFGDYIIDKDYEWSFGIDSRKVEILSKGSIGIPTFDQLHAINEIDRQSYNYYSRTVTRTTTTSDLMKCFRSNGVGEYVGIGSKYDTITNDNGTESKVNYRYFLPDYAYTDWYLMSYVSEDFFKNEHINLLTMGDYAKGLIKDNFTYGDLSSVYSDDELEILLGLTK